MKKFSVILFITLFTGVIMSSCNNNNKVDNNPAPAKFDNYSEIKKNLEELKLKGFIQELKQLPKPSLFVDLKQKQIIFTNLPQKQGDTIYVSYTNGNNNSVKKCKEEDSTQLIRVISSLFGLRKSDADNVDTLCKKIGASNDFIDDIKKAEDCVWYDKILSLLYNTCVGDSLRHLWIGIENKKLDIVREEDFPTVFLDTSKFVNIFKSAYSADSINEFAEKILKKAIIEKDIPNFIYHDFRRDAIYIGSSKQNDYERRKEKLFKKDPCNIFIQEGEDIRTFPSIDSLYNSLYKGLVPCKVNTTFLQTISTPASNTNGSVVSYWIYLIAGFLSGVVIAISGVLIYRKKINKDKKVNKSPDSVETARILMDKPWNRLKDTSSISDVLTIFDEIYNTDRKNEYLSLVDWKDKVGKKVQFYDRLRSCTTEEELLKTLSTLKQEIKIISVNSVCKDANKLNQDEAIQTILQSIDKIYKKKYTEAYLDFKKLAVENDKARKYFNISDATSLSDYLKTVVNEFQSSEHSIANAIKVLNVFKLKDNTTDKLNEIDKVLNEIDRTFEGISSHQKEYQYWDRLGIILLSISKGLIPLLKVLGKDKNLGVEEKSIIYNIQSDLIMLYATRCFLNRVQDKKSSVEEFHSYTINNLQSAIENFNKNSSFPDKIKLSTDQLPQNQMKILEESISKIREYESLSIFMDKMWNHFAKEFLKKAPECDESYILSQALNIAYHTADFLDHIKGGRDIPYCYNYAYLLNDFDPEKTRCYDFVHNHYKKSTKYSNFIYELSEKLKLDNLKILIENYLI